MRKDVKIGLSIGGVLLAVLIVYLLVPKDSDTRQFSRDTDSTNTARERQEGAGFGGSPTSPSTPTGGLNEGTPGASQTPQGTQETPSTPDRPAVPEATQPPADAPARPVDWERILTTGQVPEDARIPLAAVPPGNTGSRAETDVFGEPQNGTNSGHDINWHSAGSTPPGSPTGAAPAPTTPAAPRHTPRDHVVQQGEHLSSISLAVYGDARYYKEILKANPGLDERKLKPGTKINLPDRSTFTTAKAQQAVARLEPSIDTSKEYRVVPGDSLHKIAMKLYGKPAKSDDLYELNKDKIGDDSSRVKVGMVLKLPEPPTATSAQSTR